MWSAFPQKQLGSASYYNYHLLSKTSKASNPSVLRSLKNGPRPCSKSCFEQVLLSHSLIYLPIAYFTELNSWSGYSAKKKGTSESNSRLYFISATVQKSSLAYFCRLKTSGYTVPSPTTISSMVPYAMSVSYSALICYKSS